MKKMLLTSLFFFGVVGILNAATTINYNHTIDSSGNLTTAVAGALVETFDSSSWTWSGTGSIVSGSSGGNYAAPFNNSLMDNPDATNYLAVRAGESYQATFDDKTYTYFGLFWGSVDEYNSISFYNNGVEVATFTGSSVLSGNKANGNQSSPTTNQYINFYGLSAFDTVKLSSSQNAFEADNLAVGNPVPVPAAVWLFGSGLVGLVGFRRRAKK